MLIGSNIHFLLKGQLRRATHYLRNSGSILTSNRITSSTLVAAIFNKMHSFILRDHMQVKSISLLTIRHMNAQVQLINAVRRSAGLNAAKTRRTDRTGSLALMSIGVGQISNTLLTRTLSVSSQLLTENSFATDLLNAGLKRLNNKLAGRRTSRFITQNILNRSLLSRLTIARGNRAVNGLVGLVRRIKSRRSNRTQIARLTRSHRRIPSLINVRQENQLVRGRRLNISGRDTNSNSRLLRDSKSKTRQDIQIGKFRTRLYRVLLNNLINLLPISTRKTTLFITRRRILASKGINTRIRFLVRNNSANILYIRNTIRLLELTIRRGKTNISLMRANRDLGRNKLTYAILARRNIGFTQMRDRVGAVRNLSTQRFGHGTFRCSSKIFVYRIFTLGRGRILSFYSV